jgi:cobalt/nickel transport system permease protein
VSFVVTLILALLGQGGFTVIGLNTLVLGLGAAVARALYRLLLPGTGAAWAMASATALSQLLSTALWIVTLWLCVQLTPDIAGEHHIEESLRFVQKGVLFTLLGPLLLGAVALEALLAYGLARFLERVRPDLLPQGAAAAPPPGGSA